ncbi:hypothetical protein BU24DRAFT_490102 [Aaosphaeria arxii CBS 175.79]|uniref:Rhodopsin domain-containing protein n=1 Tax=Aaosphaeria arxii CBS 175.79 TaxID=1450172 RepID=A0A6A5XUC2_9PLEO|nr:uncharacterized protein BU24DRAFT_490102 [Aaosphaeria arxii CBS 175.79]KAF2016802.1 hypothetical protein BU24DRAFT_490102 [Aaosphaeria arxii CBS 175.79]
MASKNSSFSPYAIAAGKLPPNISHHDRYSSYNGVPMTAVLAVIAAFAIIFYGIRLHVRFNIMKKLGWDDLVCTFALIGVLMNLSCFGIASVSGPLGKHMWNITLADFLGNNFVVTSYIMQVTMTPTMGLIKLAIFLCYYEFFWALDWCRIAIYTFASLSSAFYLSLTVVQFYFMTARKGETLAKHFAGDMAARVTHIAIPTTAAGLAIDIILLLIPLVAIFQVQMPKKQKIRSASVFLVGIVAIIGSILSLVFKLKTYGNLDLTYHLILVNFFICSEMSLGICIASMPFFFRALKHHKARLSSMAISFPSVRPQFMTRHPSQSDPASSGRSSESEEKKEIVKTSEV